MITNTYTLSGRKRKRFTAQRRLGAGKAKAAHNVCADEEEDSFIE